MPDRIPLIIALSGRRGAGKNEIAKYLRVYYESKNLSVYECSFADNLKNFCINVLGLTIEQCYGSNEQKDLPSEYLWDNVQDSFLRWKFGGRKWKNVHLREFPRRPTPQNRNEFWNMLSVANPELKSGPMTGRDIMQLFGTDLIRETFGNVWATATIRHIHAANADVACITDNRFENEAELILDQPHGYIIRLTRAPFRTDEHASESSLDDFDWERDKCFVLDNANMTLEEQRCAVVPILEKIQETTDGRVR